MTANPSKAGLEGLLEKSYALEQRVRSLQETIERLRIDLEQAFEAEGLPQRSDPRSTPTPSTPSARRAGTRRDSASRGMG